MPGVVYGAALFLFGEYASSPAIDRRKWIYSLSIIVAASTLGWYLAFQTATHLGESLPLGFFAAGMVGSVFIVTSELVSWRFNLHILIYAACVLVVAGLSGFMIALLVGVHFLGIFVIWQACVLTVHAIAFGTNRKWLLICTVVFAVLAAGISLTTDLKQRADRERAEKERVQAELEQEKAARTRVEGEKAVLQTAKDEAERKAEEEKTARQVTEAQRQLDAYVVQVGRQLDNVSGYYAGMGYSKIDDYKIEALPNGGTSAFGVTLESGRDYRLVSACDRDCSDIDIYVYDWTGGLVSSDNSRDDKPEVSFRVNITGQFTIKVVMYKCSSSFCVYGIGVFGRA